MNSFLIILLFLAFAALGNAQTIPKSIIKPVSQKQPLKGGTINAAVAREQVMNKRVGHYIFKKKDHLDQKIVFTDGYVDISYHNNRLSIKGYLELQYTVSSYNSSSNTMSKREEKLKGPFEWEGKFERRTEYMGGGIGYMFGNGDDGYFATEIKSDKGETIKFYFVEVFENYVWISTGTESFNFYR